MRGVLCEVCCVRCVFKIFVGASKIWPDLLRWIAQNFALFSLARHNFHSYFSLFGGVFEGRGPAGPHPSGLLRVPTFRPLTFSRFGPPPFEASHPGALTVRGPTLRRHVGLKRHWPKQVNTFTGPNKSILNRSGLNRSGLNRSIWPKAVLAQTG